jgi:Golgi nucleoside diphosphatase
MLSPSPGWRLKRLLLSLLLTELLIVHYRRWHEPRHFGLVIDAGSTGSRIHLYVWTADGGRLLRDELRTVTPGLSWFIEQQKSVETDLGPQLASLIDQVLPLIDRPLPTSYGPVPLILLATAGMRLLPDQLTSETMRQVVEYIGRRYPLQLHFQTAEIISGHSEAFFAWLTTQQLLLGGSFPDKAAAAEKLAIVDLGGASVQFAHLHNNIDQNGSPSENVLEDCRHTEQPVCLQRRRKWRNANANMETTIHTRSYLGYGLLAMRDKYLQQIIESDHPCINESLTSESAIERCLQSIESHAFHRQSTVYDHPLPQLPDDYQIIAFSFIFDRTRDLVGTADVADSAGGGNNFCDEFTHHDIWTLLDVRWLASAVCIGRWPENKQQRYFSRLLKCLGDGQAAENEFMERLAVKRKKNCHLCWDLLYIYSLLKHGLRLNDDQRPIRVLKKVDNVELGWTLGAVADALFGTG